MVAFLPGWLRPVLLLTPVFLTLLLFIPGAYALNPEVEALLEVLQQKGILSAQEAREYEALVVEKTSIAASRKEAEGINDKKIASDEEFEDGNEKKDHWLDKVAFSGALECEFASERCRGKDPERLEHSWSNSNQEFSLSTVELGVEIAINPSSQAHMLVDYEDDEDENLVIDEAYFIWRPETAGGLYLQLGRYYPHSGEQHSFFVSDPQTVEIFEIQEDAIEIGWRQSWLTAAVGIFDGDVEADFSSDKHLGGWYADLNLHNPEGSLFKISVLAGAAFLSNVGDSDALEQEIADLNDDGEINDIHGDIGGIAAYLLGSTKISALVLKSYRLLIISVLVKWSMLMAKMVQPEAANPCHGT